jgi:hypothetical protein
MLWWKQEYLDDQNNSRGNVEFNVRVSVAVSDLEQNETLDTDEIKFWT